MKRLNGRPYDGLANGQDYISLLRIPHDSHKKGDLTWDAYERRFNQLIECQLPAKTQVTTPRNDQYTAKDVVMEMDPTVRNAGASRERLFVLR